MVVHGNRREVTTPQKMASYAGLVSSTYASGGRVWHGRLTKQGNKYLRWALVEAVWLAIRNDVSVVKGRMEG